MYDNIILICGKCGFAIRDIFTLYDLIQNLVVSGGDITIAGIEPGIHFVPIGHRIDVGKGPM